MILHQQSTFWCSFWKKCCFFYSEEFAYLHVMLISGDDTAVWECTDTSLIKGWEVLSRRTRVKGNKASILSGFVHASEGLFQRARRCSPRPRRCVCWRHWARWKGLLNHKLCREWSQSWKCISVITAKGKANLLLFIPPRATRLPEEGEAHRWIMQDLGTIRGESASRCVCPEFAHY